MNEENLDFLDATTPEGVKFYAAGIQFRPEWRENLASLEEGDELLLIPEPTNKFDPNAIQIYSFSGVFLGYVPAKKGNEKNLWVKEKLLEGKQLKAIALEVNIEASPWQALLVEIAPTENPSL